MRFHYLQHVSFEDSAQIGEWAKERGYQVSVTKLYDDDKLPSVKDFDFLAIMGGPMNIYEYEKFPWLKAEKDFIACAIKSGVKVIGICLGGQLIADVLGGKVVRNKETEIGWFEVIKSQKTLGTSFEKIADKFTAFHWHGDMFELPQNAILLASSKACANQAFQYKNALALQFHIEYSKESIDAMLENCANELIDAPSIQSQEQILAASDNLTANKKMLYELLDTFLAERNI